MAKGGRGLAIAVVIMIGSAQHLAYAATALADTGTGAQRDVSAEQKQITELAAVVNIEALDNAPLRARELLAKNGFVVLPRYYHQIFSPYVGASLPPFVTTDSLHRTYHVIFEGQLKIAEASMSEEVRGITKGILAAVRASRKATSSNQQESEAADLAEQYFQVALALVQEPAADDGDIPPGVAGEVKLIHAASGVAASPLFGYEVDYSQFKPRGFYTASEKLQRHFSVMSWYGNIAFRLKSDRETLAAMIIARCLGAVRDRYVRVDKLYADLLGASDDPTPLAYAEIYSRAAALPAFRAEAAKLPDPKVNSMVLPPAEIGDWKTLTKGMRFFGKRHIPDSEIFMCLTDPVVVGRGFPSGLDVMAANGSSRALSLSPMKDAPYSAGMQKSRAMLEGMKGHRNPSHYLDFLRLTETLWSEPAAGSPPFMKTRAYEDKNLMTALAAWASMRHAWQLHAKLSAGYLGSAEPPAPGYVEPNMEFLNGLLGLVQRTTDIFRDVKGVEIPRLEKFRQLVVDLREVAADELAGRQIVGKHVLLLRTYGQQIALLSDFEGNSWLVDANLPWMCLVSDIHSEYWSDRALEVATGGAMPIYVIVPVAGKDHLMIGGVYSYYEFHQPIASRMTDDDWRKTWREGRPPAPPFWTSSFIAPPDPAAVVEQLRAGTIPPEAYCMDDPRIEEALFEGLSPGGAFAKSHDRRAALALYAEREGPRCVRLFRTLLSSGEKDDALQAMTQLVRWASKGELADLTNKLMTSENSDDGSWLYAIDERGDEDALRALEELVAKAKSANVRIHALQGVISLRGKAATLEVLRMLPALGAEERRTILQGLAWVWTWKYEMAVRELADPKLVRSELPAATEADYRIKLVGHVLAGLESATREDVEGCATAAQELDLAEAIPLLEKLSRNPDHSISSAARRALCGMNSPAALLVLVRILPQSGDDMYSIVDRLTRDKHCLEAMPALISMLADRTDTRTNNLRVCDAAMLGLSRLDPKGPRFSEFGYTEKAHEQCDLLLDAWKAYLALGKNEQQDVSTLRRALSEDLLLLAEAASDDAHNEEDLENLKVRISWVKQAQTCTTALPEGPQRAEMLARANRLFVPLTKREILAIAGLFKEYNEAFLDYPPETPGNWESTVAENRPSYLDSPRLNEKGQLCDPWGSPYRYLRTACHSDAPFEIYSFGLNGKDEDGKGDDIVSWK